MKKFYSLFLLLFFLQNANFSFAQMERINEVFKAENAESHLRFLTADELRGRNTGSIELNIASRYIAEQFRKFGLTPMGDADGDFLQKVELYKSPKAQDGVFVLDQEEFDLSSSMALVKGSNINIEAPVVYLENKEDIDKTDLKGKILVMVVRNVREAITDSERIEDLSSKGVAAFVEIYGRGQQFPWANVLRYLNQEKIAIGSADEETKMPHLFIHEGSDSLIIKLKDNPSSLQAKLALKGLSKSPIDAYNVVGKIEGSDPELKKEHVIMCAHYDHVGVQVIEGQEDSIYNGTRDNGIGTTGLINAAEYFGKYPPKRSIVIIALTAEEKGLLGSDYYTRNPKIPLNESVFALNIDNSGYTNTEVLTLLDTARTNIDMHVYQAAEEVGLGVIGDRIPSQNYFERSDQVSFARRGVPAVNFKMSMEAFDERISEFYHQPGDEFHTIDLPYIHKYWKAYIRTAELICNWDQRPYWMPGDKFEEAGDKLYGKK